MNKGDTSDHNLHHSLHSPKLNSNQVLVYEPHDPSKNIQYYLPVYFGLIVKKVNNIEVSSASASLSGTIKFSIYYGGLPKNSELNCQNWQQEFEKELKLKEQELEDLNDEVEFAEPGLQKKKFEKKREKKKEQIKSLKAEKSARNDDKTPWFIEQLKKKVELRVNAQHGFVFDSSQDFFVENGLNIFHDEKQRLLIYIVKDTFQCDVIGNIGWAPFENLSLFCQFSLASILSSYTKNDRNIQLKFNMMDHRNDFASLYIRLGIKTGEYSIGERNSYILYTSSQDIFNQDNPESHKMFSQDRKQQEQIDKKKKSWEDKYSVESKGELVYWQHAHVKIFLYKNPATTIFSIMFPMWILAIIVQISFFLENDLGSRVSTVAIGLVAYYSFIPSVRQKLPPSSSFTFIQGMILCLLVASLLTVCRAWIDWHWFEEYQYIFYHDPLFLVSLGLNLFTFVMTILSTVFFSIWRKQYTDPAKVNNFVFSRHGWENPKADIAFRGKVKGLSDEAIEVKKGGGNMKLPPIPKTEVTANKK